MSTTKTTRVVTTYGPEGELLTTQKVEETVESDEIIEDNWVPPHLQRPGNRGNRPVPQTEAEVIARKAEQASGAKT